MSSELANTNRTWIGGEELNSKLYAEFDITLKQTKFDGG
jgi:hypothetical protein